MIRIIIFPRRHSDKKELSHQYFLLSRIRLIITLSLSSIIRQSTSKMFSSASSLVSSSSSSLHHNNHHSSSSDETRSTSSMPSSSHHHFLLKADFSFPSSSPPAKPNENDSSTINHQITSSIYERLLSSFLSSDIEDSSSSFFMLHFEGLKGLMNKSLGECTNNNNNINKNVIVPTSGCCLISQQSFTTTTSRNNSTGNEDNNRSSCLQQPASYFGVMIHDLNCIMSKEVLDKDTHNDNNKNASSSSVIKAICSVSFTPFLLRCRIFSPPSASLFQKLSNPSLVIALFDEAFESGIGDRIPPATETQTNNKNKETVKEILNQISSSSPDGLFTVLPSLDSVRLLGCSIAFPHVDYDRQTVRSFSSSSSSASSPETVSLAAFKHLEKLRAWAHKMMMAISSTSKTKRTQGKNEDSSVSSIPTWMIPRDPAQVDLWCSISYLTRNFENEYDEQDENDEGDESDQNCLPFLVPSTMLWSFIDVRFNKMVPPIFRSRIQGSLIQDFISELITRVSSSCSSSAGFIKSISFCEKEHNNDDDEVGSDFLFSKASSKSLNRQNEEMFKELYTVAVHNQEEDAGEKNKVEENGEKIKEDEKKKNKKTDQPTKKTEGGAKRRQRK